MTVNHIALVYTEKEVRDLLAGVSASILHDEITNRYRNGTLHELFRKGPLIENIGDGWPFVDDIDNLTHDELQEQFAIWGKPEVEDDVNKLLGKNSDWGNLTHVEVFLKNEQGLMNKIHDLENEIKG